MAKKFSELRVRMPAERRASSAARTQQMLDDMPMHELRRARRLSQEQIAAVLHIKQAAVSKLERRTDLYISTLRRYIEAMGGDLVIRANFPDGSVTISELGEVGDAPEEVARTT